MSRVPPRMRWHLVSIALGFFEAFRAPFEGDPIRVPHSSLKWAPLLVVCGLRLKTRSPDRV